MAGLNTNSLLDVFTSASSFGSAVTDVLHQRLIERDKADLNKMKAQFIKDSNDFLLTLQKSNDPSRWADDFNTFMKKTQGSSASAQIMNDAGQLIDNPYYVKSNNMEKLTQDFFNEQFADLQGKVAILTLNKVQQQTQTSNADTRDINWNVMSPLIAMEENKKNRTEEYDQGIGNSEKLKQGLISDLNQCIQKDEQNMIDEILKGFNIDESAEAAAKRFEDQVNAKKDQYKNRNERDPSGTITEYTYEMADGENITLQNKNRLKAAWNDLVKQEQENNTNTLSGIYTKMQAAITNNAMEQVEIQAINGANTLERMQGNRLDPSVRDHYAQLFANAQKLVNTNPGTKSGDKARETYLKDFWESEPKVAMEAVKSGTLYKDAGYSNAYAGAEALKQVAINQLYQQGLDDEDVQTEIRNHNYILNNFVNDALEYARGAKSEYGKSLRDQATNMLKSVMKNPTEEKVNYIVDWYIDTYAEKDLSKYTPEAAAADLKKLCEIVTAKEITDLGIPKNIKTDKDLGKAIQAMEENDLVFTDVYGKDRWMQFDGQSAKDILEGENGPVKKMQANLADYLHTDISNVQWTYETTAFDKTSVPIFKVNGIEYKFEAVNKKGEAAADGKAKDYRILAKYGDSDWKEVKNNKTEVKQSKNDKKNAKQATKEAKQKDAELVRKQVEIMQDTSYEQVRNIVNLTEGEWNRLPAEERRNFIINSNSNYWNTRERHLKEAGEMTHEQLLKSLPYSYLSSRSLLDKKTWDNLSDEKKLKILEEYHYTFKSNK